MNNATVALELIEAILKHASQIFDIIELVDSDVSVWSEDIKRIYDEVKARNAAS